MGENYPELKQEFQYGRIYSMEMAILSFKPIIQIEILMDFGDMGG